MTFTIDFEAIYPRDAEHRYRLYARRGGELEVLAVAAEPGGVGEAILQLHDDEKKNGGRLSDRGAFGLLDVVVGEWIILPWLRPGHGSLGQVYACPACPMTLPTAEQIEAHYRDVHEPPLGVEDYAIPQFPPDARWIGRVVRTKRSTHGLGDFSGLYRVRARGPLGYHLIPVEPAHGATRKFRSADQLDRHWKVVPDPEGE